MCPPWAVSALVSTCLPPGGNLLLASQLSDAAAQALATAGVAYSSLSVHGAVVPVQSAQLCAAPSATAGRHLLARVSASGLPSSVLVTQVLLCSEQRAKCCCLSSNNP